MNFTIHDDDDDDEDFYRHALPPYRVFIYLFVLMSVK